MATAKMPRLLRPEQAAKRLSISPANVRALILAGLLPYVNAGTKTRPHYRLRPEEVEAFIKLRSVAATFWREHESEQPPDTGET